MYIFYTYLFLGVPQLLPDLSWDFWCPAAALSLREEVHVWQQVQVLPRGPRQRADEDRDGQAQGNDDDDDNEGQVQTKHRTPLHHCDP